MTSGIDEWVDWSYGERGIFHAENPIDRSSFLNLLLDDANRIVVAVGNEKAFDSYNYDVECTIVLPRSVAKALRDALSAYLVETENAP